MEYRFSLHFFYLCSWRHLVSGVALGLLGYILGAVLATIARSLEFVFFLFSSLMVSFLQSQGLISSIDNHGVCH